MRHLLQGDLQSKGKQNVIIITGKKSFVKDAVISARIEGVNLFTEYNTIVVPVISEQEEQLDDIEKKLSKGFGASSGKEEMLSAPYFGKPAQVYTTSICMRYHHFDITLIYFVFLDLLYHHR